MMRPVAPAHHPLERGARQPEGRGQVDRDHLVPGLVAQLHEQIVARDAGIGDQHIELAHGRFRLRHQRIDRGTVGEVAWQDMDAILQSAGQRLERVRPRAGERNGRALLMECARDRTADATGRSRHQSGLAGQVEHGTISSREVQPRAALKAATSSGVPMDMPFAPSAIRLTRPDSTLPDPTS